MFRKTTSRQSHLVSCRLRAATKFTELSHIYSRLYSSVKTVELEEFTPEMIRNFSIVAHIDHGKSTLADRMLEIAGTIEKGSKNTQFLDNLKVEQNRGITVKAQTASMIYTLNNKKYLINLIDTPGHVDFSYEVSRSLAACQGCLLLVDSTQGIQAQTIANFYLAFTQNLHIIPILNKVDLPSSSVERVKAEIENIFELDTSNAICCSAKTGQGCTDIFERLIEEIPPPEGDKTKPFRALLFDTWYDTYAGVICLMAIKDGSVRKGDRLTSGATNLSYEITEVGIMFPSKTPTTSLSAGQVGYVTMNLKTTRDANIGDTFYKQGFPTELFPGFAPAKAMVFAGLYPMDASKHRELSDAIDRLTLNDASVSVQKETSSSLGQGFRLGFLGTLHMDVFRQRLEEEHDTIVINTLPTVPYKAIFKNGNEVIIRNPIDFPEGSAAGNILEFQEPMIMGTFVFPEEYLGKIIELCNRHRGEQVDCTYIDDGRVLLKFKLPMAEILTNFYDALKSITKGYASFDHEEAGYFESDLVKVNMLLNGKPVDSLSCISHRSHADKTAKLWVSKLKNVINRQLIDIVIQGSAGGKIVARDVIKATRKDVTAKCYGGIF
jgi:translation factor GUF1, mitochondrial